MGCRLKKAEVEAQTRAISRNNSPDIFFNQSVNPYRGCEHGCVYCYARPGHAYEGLSPGLDFETRLFARTNLPVLLARELDAFTEYYTLDSLEAFDLFPHTPHVEALAVLTRK